MNKKFNNEIITGICVDLSSEGKGVVKDKEKVIFVDGLFPGEEVEVEIMYSRAKVYFGRVKKLLKISKDRIEPKCQVCTACGGCQFQQLAYMQQLKYKTNKVKNDLERIGHLSVCVSNCVGMDAPYNYRNKIQVPIGYDKAHHIVSGFYRENSHEIIPIKGCAIEDIRSENILTNIKRLMPLYHLRPYEEDKGRGEVRHVLIRTSYYKKEVMVVLVLTVDTFPGQNNFIKELIKACPEITTVVFNINKRRTNVILGEQEKIVYGSGFILDKLCDLSFRISSKSFYQINPIQCEKLYKIAIENAKLNKEDTILDAYCGIGTIGLVASKEVNKVIGVEINKDAIKDAINNARANNITNAQFICDDASHFMQLVKLDKTKIDVVFLDPPRSGSDENFLNAMMELAPKKIIYISCNPATLARDLNHLNPKYEIASVQPVDMFPFTAHVETVALLVLKDSKK